MRHALILSIALTALAGAAAAQSRPPANGQAAGLRYLTWAGKSEAAALVRDAPPPSAAPLRPATARTAPPRVIPHGGTAPAPAARPPAPTRNALTPANAWMRPAPAPVVEAEPAAPPPARIRTPEPAPAPAQADAAVADPMAPRRDAAIFRMGSATAESVASMPAPAQQAAAAYSPGGRYYSVHRQNGRQPDAVAMPAPVYLDALPVEMERAPQSDDLAEPPAAPTVLRDANGRIRPAPPSTGDDL